MYICTYYLQVYIIIYRYMIYILYMYVYITCYPKMLRLDGSYIMMLKTHVYCNIRIYCICTFTQTYRAIGLNVLLSRPIFLGKMTFYYHHPLSYPLWGGTSKCNSTILFCFPPPHSSKILENWRGGEKSNKCCGQDVKHG